MSFAGRMSYGDYLHLDELLAAQRPVTTVHDEMLFIVQHHTSELWIKLLLHELDCAATLVRTDRLQKSEGVAGDAQRASAQLGQGAADVIVLQTVSAIRTATQRK